VAVLLSVKSESVLKRKAWRVVGCAKSLRTVKNWISLFLFMEMPTKRTFEALKEREKSFLLKEKDSGIAQPNLENGKAGRQFPWFWFKFHADRIIHIAILECENQQ
jgi:hypothetical protein